jgi:hypothetical protein
VGQGSFDSRSPAHRRLAPPAAATARGDDAFAAARVLTVERLVEEDQSLRGRIPSEERALSLERTLPLPVRDEEGREVRSKFVRDLLQVRQGSGLARIAVDPILHGVTDRNRRPEGDRRPIADGPRPGRALLRARCGILVG